MKKLLSITLALMLVFGMLSFSASAVEEVSYVNAEYSAITVNEMNKTQVLESDTYITELGKCKVHSVYLEYGKSYYIGAMLLTEQAGASCAIEMFVLPNNLTGDLYGDVLAGNYVSNARSVINEFYFTPEATGYYKLIITPNCHVEGTSLYGDDTELEYIVEEMESVTVSINNVEDFVEMTNNACIGTYENKRVNAVFFSDLDLSEAIYNWPEYTILYVRGNGHVLEGVSGTLFGDVYECVVDDLDVDFYVETADGSYITDFGVYAGLAYTAKFTNCDADGAIYLCGDYAEDLGAFVGDVGNVTFDNCTLFCEIMADYDAEYIGGYVGYGWDKFKMSNCAAEISIDVRNSDTNYYCIGGVVGYIEDCGVVENCFVYADIIALNTTAVGGFVGCLDAENSFTNVAVEGSVEGLERVGGFMGDSSCCGGNVFINCYAAVDVEAAACFGGFAGNAYEYENFINCYAAGNITYTGEEGLYAGDGGTFLGYSYSSDIAIENCYGNMSDDFDIYGYCDEPIQCSAFSVNFTSDAAVENLEKSLNEYVDESDIEGLVYWGGRNNMNGPKLVIGETVDALDITFKGFEVGGSVDDFEIVIENVGVLLYDMIICTDPDDAIGSRVSGNFESGVTYYVGIEAAVNNIASYRFEDYDFDNTNITGAIVTEYIPLESNEYEVVFFAAVSLGKEGDVNADGNVDVFDYMMVKSHYFKKYTLTDAEFARADLVKDGVIDVFDYMAVKQKCFNR